MTDKLVDAVRVLFYGNGDLKQDVQAVEEALAEADGIDIAKLSGGSRIYDLVERLDNLMPDEYAMYSSEEWNK